MSVEALLIGSDQGSDQLSELSEPDTQSHGDDRHDRGPSGWFSLDRIHTRILLMTLVPVWLVIGLWGAYLVGGYLSDADRQIRVKTQVLAELTAVRLAPSLTETDRETFIGDARELLAQHSEIRQVRVLLPDGDEWARLPDSVLDDSAGLLVSAPIPSPGLSDRPAPPPLGEVELRHVTPDLQARTVSHAVLLFGTGVLITLILIGIASRRITQPFQRLVEAMGQVRHGDLEVRLSEESPGELGELERGFNGMASDLASANERMHNRIDQATQELHQAMEALELRNAELDRARKRAEEMSQIKSEFLANMSHEIRTPMNGILGFADLLQRSDLNGTQREHIDTIIKSATTLMRLVNGILDFSKLESGRLVLTEEPFRLRECIENVTTLLAPQAYTKGLELLSLIYNDVPDSLIGDPMRIGQIVTNLLDNAIKFTERGEIVLRVMLDQESKTKVRLMFSVTDSGIGIPLAEQDHLFNAFQQGRVAAKRLYGGTGLGLSICRSLAEAMCGTISVSSREGEGACFRATLELRRGKAKEERTSEALQGQRACLVDANPLSRIALRNALEQLGLTVQDYEQTPEPESLIESEGIETDESPFDLLVVGLPADPSEQLPFLINAEFRLRDWKLPVLALVGTTDEARLAVLTEQGATRSAAKMLKRDKLADELLRTLSLPQQTPGAPGIPDGQAASAPVRDDSLTDRALLGRLVLVADDNDINLELMRSLLSLQGARVLTATNGRQALDLALQNPVDLVFMDIHMPELDGIETLAALRARSRRHIPVIALTADAAPQNQAAISNARFDGSLIKPLQDADLRKMVVEVLLRPPNRSWSGPRVSGPLIKAEPVSLPSRDPEQALRIAGGSQAIADKLFQALLDELPDSIAAIQRANEFGQWDDLWQRTHRLHGSAAVCGVPALKALLSRLEGVIKQRWAAETGALLTQLQAEVEALQTTTAEEERGD